MVIADLDMSAGILLWIDIYLGEQKGLPFRQANKKKLGGRGRCYKKVGKKDMKIYTGE